VEIYPIKVVISHLSKTSYLSTNYVATIKHWDQGRIRSACPSIKSSINKQIFHSKLSWLIPQIS